MAEPLIPDPALVVLIGASGSGKSTWAAEHYRAVEMISSDHLRSIVGSGPADQEASKDAFALLDQLVTARTGRRLTTVIDTTGLERDRRLGYLGSRAEEWTCGGRRGLRDRGSHLPGPKRPARSASAGRRAPNAAPRRALSWRRNRGRGLGSRPPRFRPQHRLSPRPAEPMPGHRIRPTGSRPLRVVLQVSRFPWGEDPAAWLTAIATMADQLGFDGIALMDHLIQIPQVGRAWEPIPEPWVTLGLLAGLDTGLRLGTLVSPVTFHPPGVLAKSVATLDALTRRTGVLRARRRAGGNASTPPSGYRSPPPASGSISWSEPSRRCGRCGRREPRPTRADR